MKNWVTARMAALITIAISPVNAQSSMPQMGAAESYRQMNEGKSAEDLFEVVDDWNDWATTISTTTLRGYCPHSRLIDLVREAGWFGYTPNFTEMGKGLHAWMTKGQKSMPDLMYGPAGGTVRVRRRRFVHRQATLFCDCQLQ